MRKHFALLFSALCALSASAFAQGGPNPANAVLVFNDNNGAAASGSFAPGATITLDIRLDFMGPNPPNASGITFFFEARQGSTGTGAGVTGFSITNRQFTNGTETSPWTDPGTNAITFPQAINGTSGNANDLGSSGGAVSPSLIFIARLTITISGSLAPGTYTLQNITTNENAGKGAVIDSNATSFDLPTSLYTVTVVPEPTTWSLIVLGGLACVGVAAMRRRRA